MHRLQMIFEHPLTRRGEVRYTPHVTETVDQPAQRVDGVLAAQQLTKRFGGVTAVADVSLTIQPGEAVGVIGPNGAGKSSLLKMLAGVYRPDEGTVHLDGIRIDALAAHHVPRRGIALAHQIPRPFPTLTVRQNLAVAAGARHSWRPERHQHEHLSTVLSRCQLAGKADRPAASLPLLDRKRLELARAVASDPAVLLLDEVAAGLVGEELDQVIELVQGLHRDGLSVVLVEHVEGVVRSVVSRVMVLEWGHVIAEGTPAQIEADPKVQEVYLGTSAPASSPTTPTPETPSTGTTTDATPSANPVSGGTACAAGAGLTGRLARPAPGTAAPALELTGIVAGYGDLIAVRDVTLEVGQGEVVAVLGANGAGKSTLAAVASGLITPASGTVRLDGQDVTARSAHDRARAGIAHCPEGRKIFAELTVHENLTLSAPLRLDKREMLSRLEAIHAIFPVLAERAGQQAGTFSGGQQQMLAVGRALMSRPRLLICDEISLGLAPVAIDVLYDALRAVNAAGVAILLIEQSVHRSAALADRAYVLERGRVSYDGDPSALTEQQTLREAYFGLASSPVPSG